MGLIHFFRRTIQFILYGQPRLNTTVSDLHIHYLSPHNRLLGKKALITGGGKGLGHAIAERYVNEGAQIVIVGRDEQALKNTAVKLNCKYIVKDITDINGLSDLLTEAYNILGDIDILVNNAGISLHEPDFINVTEETFDLQIKTNLKAPFFLTQAYVNRLLRNNKKGNILFISSETGMTVDLRPYGWTKSIINSMVQGMAYRLRANEIRINAICPGVTATEMTGFKSDENLYPYGKENRIILPDEIAEVATFIVSDAAKLLNGQILVCNEGKTINARWK